MESTAHPKRITKQSEQVFDPIQTPILINNEMYLMIQQDIRRIEETRHLSYAMITSDGQIIPVANPLQ